MIQNQHKGTLIISIFKTKSNIACHFLACEPNVVGFGGVACVVLRLKTDFQKKRRPLRGVTLWVRFVPDAYASGYQETARSGRLEW
jgi:hypothetical protein